jgi:hypothetical protein
MEPICCPEMSITNLRCVTTQKSEDLNITPRRKREIAETVVSTVEKRRDAIGQNRVLTGELQHIARENCACASRIILFTVFARVISASAYFAHPNF